MASVTVPVARPRKWKNAWFATICILSNLPDFPFPWWGHARYEVSHSLFVTLALLLVLGLPLWSSGVPRGLATRAVLVAAAAAWVSHLLLDSLYNHGRGIGIFWPVSSAHLALPVPWFSTLQLPVRSQHNLRVLLTELGVYGSLLVPCVLVRWRLGRRNCR